MTTNPLDEIQARADLAQGALEEFNLGIATTRFALDEANNSAEDVPRLLAALRAVEAVHRQVPVYSLPFECEHDPEVSGVEMDDGEIYCIHCATESTCDACGELARDNMDGEFPTWPCPTITAIREALEVGPK